MKEGSANALSNKLETSPIVNATSSDAGTKAADLDWDLRSVVDENTYFSSVSSWGCLVHSKTRAIVAIDSRERRFFERPILGRN
jgi:hypothetical protein